MIELRELEIGYKGRSVCRLPNVSLGVGEVTCLLGRNGAGKSTLLKTLAGFLPAIGGDVMVDGRPLAGYAPDELARMIGVVLTERIDVRDMSVRELVSMGRQPYTGFWGGLGADDRQAVDEAIEQVGIESLCHREVHALSDGERQKVMIAKALAQGTPIILLDEPSAFLDYPSKVELMRLLARLAHEQNKSVLMSTHDVELTVRMADVLWLLGDGLQTGRADQMMKSGVVERFFGIGL